MHLSCAASRARLSPLTRVRTGQGGAKAGRSAASHSYDQVFCLSSSADLEACRFAFTRHRASSGVLRDRIARVARAVITFPKTVEDPGESC